MADVVRPEPGRAEAEPGGSRRRWAAAIGVIAAASVLSACDKPLPRITVYGDGHSVIVPAANYRFPDGAPHVEITDYSKAPTLRVQTGSELLVDVPHDIAVNSWVVAAFTLNAEGKSTPIAGAGSALHDEHTTRLAAAPADVSDYYLQVVELRGATQTGGWVLHVKTTG